MVRTATTFACVLLVAGTQLLAAEASLAEALDRVDVESVRRFADRWSLADSSSRVRPDVADVDPSETHFRRGLFYALRGDQLSAVVDLERCHLDPAVFSDADRAAFLLALSYSYIGDDGGVARIAADVRGWKSTAFTRWVLRADAELQVRLGVDPGANAPRANGAGTNSPDANVAEASDPEIYDAEGRALLAWLAYESGENSTAKRWIDDLDHALAAQLRALMDPNSAASIGDFASLETLDDRVPHLEFRKALDALADAKDAADSLAVAEQLAHWISLAPDHPDAPQMRLQLASLHLAANRFRDSQAVLQTSRSDLQLRRSDLLRVQEEKLWSAVWEDWVTDDGWHPLVLVEGANAEGGNAEGGAATGENWIRELAGDTRRETVVLPARPLREAMGSAPLSRLVPLPEVATLREVADLESEARSAYNGRERARWQLQQARMDLERRRGYVRRGIDRVRGEIAGLQEVEKELARIESRLDRLFSLMDQVTEAEIRRILSETERILNRVAETRTEIDAVEHFYDQGPDEARRTNPPEGYPDRNELLNGEDSLAQRLGDTADAFRNNYPDVIRRSRDEVWKPRIRESLDQLAARTNGLLARAAEEERTLLAKLESLDPGQLLAGAHEDVRAWDHRVDDAVSQWLQHRQDVVEQAVAAELERLHGLDEGLHYQAALVEYELAVRGQGNLELAVASWDDFLLAYPDAVTRAHALYRLADLELTQSKDTFRREMASYLAIPEPNRGSRVVPILDTGRALPLYEDLVASHPDFPHLDAALYHVGVLRADEGDPRGIDALHRLLADYPQSKFRQESQLRVADFHFDGGRLEEAASFYELAAAGEDAGLSVIALYKLGWSHFRKDRFTEAAGAFARGLDLYEAGAQAEGGADLRGESLDYLIHSLARAGGGETAATFFDGLGPRSYSSSALLGVSALLRRFSLFGPAVETDMAWLERFGSSPEALSVAANVVETYELWERPGTARKMRLQFAETFQPGSDWYRSADSDSLRDEANRFSRDAYYKVALFHHHRARTDETGTEDWERALQLYDRMLALWPNDAESARLHYNMGEAAQKSGKPQRAYAAFGVAAQAEDRTFSRDAAWQQVAVLDTWYESEKSDSLANALVTQIDRYLSADPFELRGPDLTWRQAGVAFAHGWDELAIEKCSLMAQRYPRDRRAAEALTMRGDAYYRGQSYGDAATAYEEAARFVEASSDSTELRDRLYALVPHCAYLHGESVHESGETHAAAQIFERVATRWPEFEESENALYRAGTAYAEEDRSLDAVRCFEELIRTYPDGVYRRDAYLALAAVYEDDDRLLDSARVLERFHDDFRDDAESGPALLQAVELWRKGGDEYQAARTERRYIDNHPEDTETAAVVYHREAGRELERLGEFAPISTLLDESSDAGAESNAKSDLQRYLHLAKEHPEYADAALMARVDFLVADETHRGYDSVRLTQPLKASLAQKKELLEQVIAEYKQSVSHGVSPWSQAATYRIGQCLISFGDRLLESERPADLSMDDRQAYDEVLEEQAWEFYGQGEDVWSQLLTQIDPALEDEGGWIERTRSSLWPRVSARFVHFAEAAHPIVEAAPPGSGGSE